VLKNTNVVNFLNLFTKQCFKYIMKTSEMIWNESNKDKVLKNTYKILIKHYKQVFHGLLDS
jgi:hypothetical protein